MAERDWVLCFEQWPGANRFHVRRPPGAMTATGKREPFFCGLYSAGLGPIRFEDELAEGDMCKTCRKRALKQAEKETSADATS